jgi:hypothetical protein
MASLLCVALLLLLLLLLVCALIWERVQDDCVAGEDAEHEGHRAL